MVGYRDATGWHVTNWRSIPGGVKYDTWYDLLVAVNGTQVTVTVGTGVTLTTTFGPRVIEGDSHGLNKGLLGFGSDNSRGLFDNVQLRVLPAQLTLDRFENFADNAADWLTPTVGNWGIENALTLPAVQLRYLGTGSGGLGVSLADLGKPISYDSYLGLDTVVRAGSGQLGIVFDYYEDFDFKYVVVDTANNKILLGHRMGTAWVVDSSVDFTLNPATDHSIGLTLRGASVSVVVDGQTVMSFGYNSALVDGRFGTLIIGSSGTFDDVRVRTNDSKFNEYQPGTAQVSISDASVVEGNSGTKTVQLTISLSQPLAEAATVQWSTGPGTALAGSDFTGQSGTVQVLAGETIKTITVSVIGDMAIEPDETFNVTLSNVTGGITVTDGLGVVTIVNDDVGIVPTVTVTATNGAEGGGSIVVTFTRTGATTSPLTVTVAKGGTSVAADVNAPTVSGGTFNGSTVTFGAGSSTVTLMYSVVDDALVEGAETLTMTINAGAGYSVGSPSASSATIADNDVQAGASVSINSVNVSEGNNGGPVVTVTLTITRTGDLSGSSTVSWATQADTALAGSDYTTASGTVTFSAGQTTKTIVITIAGDKKSEPTEQFKVVLSSPSSGTTIATGTGVVTIFDNDGALLAAAAGPSSSVRPLSEADAVNLLAVVVRRWLDAGATADQLAGLTIHIADLPGTKLADTLGRTITLDIDAAGWGWALSPVALTADRIDLASVLAHELGHVLGLEHGAGVMSDVLAPGESLPAPQSSLLDSTFAGRVTAPTTALATHDPVHTFELIVAPSIAASVAVVQHAAAVVPLARDMVVRPVRAVTDSTAEISLRASQSQQREPLTVALRGLALVALVGRRRGVLAHRG